jgi:hypothetical protein
MNKKNLDLSIVDLTTRKSKREIGGGSSTGGDRGAY